MLFNKDIFLVKKIPAKFNPLIQDSSCGLIGISSNYEHAVQRWCLLYHHTADVTSTLLNFFKITQDSTEDVQPTHKEWNSSRIEKDEKDVQTVINLFFQHDNHFAESNTPLRNIVSGTLSPSETAASFLLSLEKLAQDEYKIFKTERMDRKTKGLFAPIHCNNIFSFYSMPTKKRKSRKQHHKMKVLLKQFWFASQRNLS